MFNDLKHEYQKTIDEVRLVSFDVFDTLIHRIVFRPVNVFDLLEKRIKHTDIALHNPAIVANLSYLREGSEKAAREKCLKHHNTNEIGLLDIYEMIQAKTGWNKIIIETIMEEELLLEQAIVYPNPWMKLIYDYAMTQGKQVILCSDMYLPSGVIQKLLEKSGFIPPFTIFVSGELKKSKHEGSMYDFVCERYGIRPDEMAHFGDNEHADFHVAMAHGIKAHHFNMACSKAENKLRFPVQPDSSDRAIINLIQGTIKNVLMNSDHDHDFWFDIGVQIFGPMFFGYFLWLITQLRQQPVEKLLFFARDAFFCHALYGRYAAELGVTIPAEYVYVSRTALLLPSFTDMNIHRTWYLFCGRSTRSVKEHLARIGVDASLVRREIMAAGFGSEYDISQNGDIRMFNLLIRLFPIILEVAKSKRSIVADYIRQAIGNDERIGIVDIGWSGNMQGSFSRLLQLSKSDFELIGYYYGTFDAVLRNYLPKNTYKSYLVRESHPRNLSESLLSGGIELMEFSHMAPHGTTLGYENLSGKIHPILESNADDKEMQDLASRLQAGALRFVETIMPAAMEIGIERLVSFSWSDPFFRLVDNPTPEEAEILGAITHSDSATDTVRRLPLAEKLDPEVARLRGTEYHKAFERAYWKKAFQIRNNGLD